MTFEEKMQKLRTESPLNTKFTLATGDKEPFAPGVSERRYMAATYSDKLQPLLLSGRPPQFTTYKQYTFVVDGSVTELVKEADKRIEELERALGEGRFLHVTSEGLKPSSSPEEIRNFTIKTQGHAPRFMKTREEAVERVHEGLDHGLLLEKATWHYGRVELRDLMDFIYGEKPQNDRQKIRGD